MTWFPGRGHPVHLVLGLIAWSLWFVIAYGGLSLACVSGLAGWWVNIGLLAGGVLVGLALGCTAWRLWRKAPRSQDSGRFIARTGALLYLIPAFASVAIVLPGLLMAPCI